MDITSYLLGRMSGSGAKGLKVEVVEELPEIGEEGILYLVPKQTTGDNDVFDEWIYVGEDWEHIGSTDIDLSNYCTKDEAILKYVVMPTANNSHLGEIVQFIGTTSNDYTNGYFYECVSDGGVTPTYSWIQKDVQPNATYTLPIAGASTLGGIKVGSGLSIDVNGILSTDVKIIEWSQNIFDISHLDTYAQNNLRNPGIYLIRNICTTSGTPTYNKEYTPYWGIINIKKDRWGDLTLEFISLGSNPHYYAIRAQNSSGSATTSNKFEKNCIYMPNFSSTAQSWSNINDTILIKKLNLKTFYGEKTITDLTTTNKNSLVDAINEVNPTQFTGYDSAKTQVLKNINGTLTWVDE